MKNRLTAIQIKNAPDSGSLSDGGGLILVRRNGNGKWVYRYSYLGKRRDMGLGSQADLTLSEARKARDQWAKVLASGADPIAARDALRAAEIADRERDNPTFSTMAERVFEARKATLRGDGDRGRWWSPLKLYVLPKIGRRPIAEIMPSDIADALKPIWREKHPTAVKAIERTRIVFRDAALMGADCDQKTVARAKHMLGVVHHKTKHIEAVPWQAVPALYADLCRMPNVSALAARWAVLTLVRSMAVRGARFDEIEGDVWTVPASRVKGKRGKVSDFRVPLSPEALAVVELARGGDLLFPGRTGRPITDVAVAKALPAGTIHGLRTTFRTWVQDQSACSWDVAETVLGHQIGNRVERSYARSDLLDQRRVVMDAWARFVTGAEANVVQFRKGEK